MRSLLDKMKYGSALPACLTMLWAGLLPLLLTAQEKRHSAWFEDGTSFTNVEDFMRRNAPALGITEAAAGYRVKKQEKHPDGSRHICVLRTQEGIDVLGGEGWIHVRENGTAWYGGGYVPALGKLPGAGERRNARDVIATALTALKQDYGVNVSLSVEQTDALDVTLVITRRDRKSGWTTENTVLAYEVDLDTLHLEQSSLLVDAMDGSILEERRQPRCTHTGTTNALYEDGPREFCTSLWEGNYFLKDDIWRYYTQRTEPVAFPEGYEVFSSDGIFNENAVEIAAASLHWAGQQTVKYFYYAHNFHIHDYLGGYLQLRLNPNTAPVLAPIPWHPDRAEANKPRTATFGMGGISTAGPYVAPDIVGHEVGHLIVHQRIWNYNEDEAGIMHEAFADMFGVMVESYARPTDWEYLMGEDLNYPPNGYIRNMASPNLAGHPDTYLGTNWQTPITYANVHTNAGVIDYWYYLLSEGGSGVNDNAFAYNVTGIGPEKAAQVALKTAMSLFQTADFSDARNASMFAVIDLFGYCSEEAKQVIKAWDAVGVAANTDPVVISPDGAVNCTELTAIHGAAIPYDKWFLGNGTINCGGVVPNGAPVRLHAVKSITMLPGFFSGDNFLAIIEDCPVVMKHRPITSEEFPPEVTTSEGARFQLYPNPTNGQVRLVLAPDVMIAGKQSTVRVLDMNGRVVYQERVDQEPRVSLDLNGEPAGAYIVEVSAGGHIHRERLILMR